MKEENILVAVVLLTFAGIGAYGVLQPYYEARAFNRITGAHATYWDAFWTELRVQERPDGQREEP